jgi:8-oxo-dGTP diphosphatase
LTRGSRRLRCKITGGGLATNDEASDFRWATETEVPGLMDQAYAIRVLDALRETATAAVRPTKDV